MPNGSDFEWHSKTKKPGISKSNQIAAILDFSSGSVFEWSGPTLGKLIIGQDLRYSCSYGLDHSNTKPSQIQTSNRSDFE